MKKQQFNKLTISIIFIVVLALFTCIMQSKCMYDDSHLDSSDIIKTNEQVLQDRYDSVYNKLEIEVGDYVKQFSNDSTLAGYLVKHGISHNIDICFMMSQAEQETKFATVGIGKPSSRKSMFGVMRKTYIDYDQCINDYCIIIKCNYLGETKTIADLMENFVNLSGFRYASDSAYEAKIKNIYDNIQKLTKINKLQLELIDISIQQN